MTARAPQDAERRGERGGMAIVALGFSFTLLAISSFVIDLALFFLSQRAALGYADAAAVAAAGTAAHSSILHRAGGCTEGATPGSCANAAAGDSGQFALRLARASAAGCAVLTGHPHVTACGAGHPSNVSVDNGNPPAANVVLSFTHPLRLFSSFGLGGFTVTVRSRAVVDVDAATGLQTGADRR